jgi:hypothetical protein
MGTATNVLRASEPELHACFGFSSDKERGFWFKSLDRTERSVGTLKKLRPYDAE